MWDIDLEDWYGYYYYAYEYNENNEKTYEHKWTWSSDLFDWINSYYIDYEYGEFGQTLHEHWKWSDENNNWYGYLKGERFYNDLGHDTLYLTYLWDNDWLLNWKYESIFDNESNRIQTLMFSWNSETSEFENMRKTIYEYNSFGEYTLMLDADWSDVQMEYLDSRKWIREYSETGMVLLWHYSTWSDNEEEWIPSWKHEYQYDENDYETSNAKWLWDNDNQIWYGNFMNEHTYDSDGNIISYFNYWWSSEMSEWEGSTGYYNYFDNEGFLNYVINYDWDSEIFDWHLNTKDFYYYRIISGINEIDSTQLLVYPSPASDFITIEYDTENKINVEIITLSGFSVILQSNYTSGNIIDVRNLSSGIYILSIIDGNKKINKKIIIK